MKTTTTALRNLITKSTSTTLISKMAFALLILFAMVACKKETPITTDTIKPKMKLSISGYGVNKTFDSDSSDYYSDGILYLKPDVAYNFALTISDTGGVRWLEHNSDTSVFSLRDVTTTPTAGYTIVSSTIGIYKILLDASTPYSSCIISGKIYPRGLADGRGTFIFQCLGSDFTPNLVGLNIPCIVAYQPLYGYGWKAQ